MMRGLLLLILLAGCGQSDVTCLRSSECPPRHHCAAGYCAATPIDIEIESAESGAGPIVVAPADAELRASAPDAAFDCRRAHVGELHIEEVLADVPTGDVGDANRDGVRDAYDDEFVEITNSSADAVGLRGVDLVVNDHVKFRFDAGECLEAHGALVVFAGGPAAPDRRVAGRRFGLANSGGKVVLKADHGVLDEMTYGDDSAGSWVRWPPHEGEFESHLDRWSSPFSPGVCPGGESFAIGCSEVEAESPDAG